MAAALSPPPGGRQLAIPADPGGRSLRETLQHVTDTGVQLTGAE